MSHEIETHTNADGTTEAAAVFARVPAWHRLGTVFDGDLTTDDVMKQGHLGGWDLRTEELTTASGLSVPGKFGIIRTNPFTGKPEANGGTVGNVYKPIQNEDCATLLSTIVDETEGRYETAGSLGPQGQRVFVTMKMPNSILVGGVDAVDRYLTLINPTDGTGSLLLLDTPIRAVCANTVRAAISNNVSQVKIWHTEKANKTIAEIREALKVTFAFDEAFEAEAEKMIQATITEGQFVKELRKIWPVVKDESNVRAVNTQRKRELELVKLFTGSETMSEAVRGTKWGAYNAVTEYLDWFTPVGDKRDASAVRASRTVRTSSSLSQAKEKAWSAFAVKSAKAVLANA